MKNVVAKSPDQKKKTKAPKTEGTETLIEDFLPKIKYTARRLSMKLPPHIDVEDLISCGITGLLDAVDRFDPKKNVKFSTFAEFRIRGAMLDYLREIDWCPRSVRQKANNLQSVYTYLENMLGRPPKEEEVAQELDISIDKLRKELALINGISIFSIDEIEGDEEPSSFTHRKMLANYLTEKKNDEDFLLDLKEVLTEAIEELPENEKLIISLYYYEELTMKEIGTILGLTESRICQIHNQAILRLRGKTEKSLYATPGPS
ncbi:MAG: FliA/WhiG family RNA polymerase sigma factor [Deltaproteobacteria bacterium]|nr:FliA/WhiG family RNA polymerase sigma factor [Deltaproteobacteria bacterium]NIS77833.1 FliA/WhiG family RNA polymerase sigma factor [Deltaproteobacteria bacterium]